MGEKGGGSEFALLKGLTTSAATHLMLWKINGTKINKKTEDCCFLFCLPKKKKKNLTNEVFVLSANKKPSNKMSKKSVDFGPKKKSVVKQ